MRPLPTAIRLHVVLEPADQQELHDLSELLDVPEDEAVRVAVREHLAMLREGLELRAALQGEPVASTDEHA